MERSLQPELLDSLAPDDPAALHNRRDLRLINRFIGTVPWFARELARRLRPGERVLEIGAGTGELTGALAARGVPIDGLDLWPRPVDLPRSSAWHRADLRTFGGYAEYPVVIGNLILHQFSERELAELGRRLAPVRVVLASEPARVRRAQVFLAVGAWVFRGNHVTRHDAQVSVRAGFLKAELPGYLGLSRADWRWTCGVQGIGTYRMMAEKRGD